MRYPTAVFEVNDALSYLQDNADRLHIDPDRIVMAGDSAGSQLSSQIASIITNPEYAARMHLTPAMKPEQLRGVVLNCGVYDMATLHYAASGLTGWGYDRNPAITEMSTIDFVTAEFPPTFITGGNADPLTARRSQPFAERLHHLGVAVTTLLFSADYEPALPHEYQFNLDNHAGEKALTQTFAFLADCFRG